MSLEDALKANTAALEANTAALLKSGGSASAGSTKAADKPAASEYKAKHSLEEMQAIMGKYKEKAGIEKAREIVQEKGKVKTMKEITDPKAIDAVYDAAEAALKALEEDM